MRRAKASLRAESPVLYVVETDVAAGGVTVDSTSRPFGIRFFEFQDQGVDLHATQGALGAAIAGTDHGVRASRDQCRDRGVRARPRPRPAVDECPGQLAIGS
jgi:hypothetical protein